MGKYGIKTYENVLLAIKEFNPDGIALTGSTPSAPAILMKQKKGLIIIR